jgi:hypothetical protein
VNKVEWMGFDTLRKQTATLCPPLKNKKMKIGRENNWANIHITYSRQPKFETQNPTLISGGSS